MKNLVLFLLFVAYVLSACSANLTFEAEGGLITNIISGDDTQNGPEPQQGSESGLLRDPLIIVLLIVIASLLITLIITISSRRPG